MGPMRVARLGVSYLQIPVFVPSLHTNISITNQFSPSRPSEETYQTKITDTMPQTTDSKAQTAFPFAEKKGWYTVCPNVGGGGDQWCFGENCRNHKRPRRWHWTNTDWKKVMDWLKEQDLGERLNEINWKLEYDVPDHNAELSISVRASSWSRPDICVHCSQTSKDAEDRVNFLAVKCKRSRTAVEMLLSSREG
ncbi:hypothetical protein LZ31DRAFT_561443 [Colletotrichum somersetense]|nr:hypothetical protein LZ31DRAFT_561443 [Colletotrichum somersetense]